MRFVVHKNDFDITHFESENKSKKFVLSSATSVGHIKQDFFSLLATIGELVQVDDTNSIDSINELCSQNDVIYSAVNGFPPDGIKCRFLGHSLGGFMVSGGFLNGWESRKTTVMVVTSEIQKQQMVNGLGKACPNLCVVTPNISNVDFYFPVEKKGSNKDELKLLYAGRIIANKGITQTVRALNIWETPQIGLSLVGDFEEDFFIYHSNAYHTTFPLFFEKEIIRQNRNTHLTIQKHKAVPREKLKEYYWDTDCLIYPSFHEDENFGYVPREAMLCGANAIVTDFCGLGQLKKSKAKVIKTYPSLAGVRYSLKELYDNIIAVGECSTQEKTDNAIFNKAFIEKETDNAVSVSELKKATQYLLSLDPEPAPEGGWREKKRVDRLEQLCPEKFSIAIQLKGDLPQDGLYVDGTGFPPEGRWFSDAHFMQAIQSLYTTLPTVPKIKTGYTYRGFWRIKLWDEELAIVEFGFPGPRVKHLTKEDFLLLKDCMCKSKTDEPIFIPFNTKAFIVLQDLLELGYIVPDIIE